MNHNFSTALSHAQPVDPRVSERIRTLVKSRTSVKEVQKCLRFLVQDALFAGETPPPESSWAFFPTKKDFENHIQTALRKEQFSNEDQENVMAFLGDFKTREPTANIFFRPFQIHKTVQNDDLGEDAVEIDDQALALARKCTNTLMSCYQSGFMRQIRKKCHLPQRHL